MAHAVDLEAGTLHTIVSPQWVRGCWQAGSNQEASGEQRLKERSGDMSDMSGAAPV